MAIVKLKNMSCLTSAVLTITVRNGFEDLPRPRNQVSSQGSKGLITVIGALLLLPQKV